MVVEFECDGYLVDKLVMLYLFEGWVYVDLLDDFEDVEGVWFVCGEGVDENVGVSEGDLFLLWIGDVVDVDDVE